MVFDGLFDALMVYLYSLVNGHVGQILERDENEKKGCDAGCCFATKAIFKCIFQWEGNENTQ